MEHKVREFLEHNFDGMQVNLETLSSGRVSGVVIWAGFEQDADQTARQQRVRTALHQHFGAEVQLIGVLLTYTPNEIEEMTAA